MQTINVKIEEPLLVEIDQAANNLEMSRDDFIQAALQRAISQQKIIALERKHAEGYAKQPQTVEEIAEWESEQVWGDE